MLSVRLPYIVKKWSGATVALEVRWQLLLTLLLDQVRAPQGKLGATFNKRSK
jgi:hypothetical protein